MTATHNSSTEPAAAGASTKENPRFALCDRLSRTRDNSQRQLPTDQDYAVSTREYQTDQSSLKLPRLLLALSSKTANKTTPTDPRIAQVDTVTPYQGDALIENDLCAERPIRNEKRACEPTSLCHQDFVRLLEGQAEASDGRGGGRMLGELAFDALVDCGPDEFGGDANAVHDGAVVR